jgi:LysR family transcriptional regulator, nitrogen assimilation regulatory protein
MEIRRLSYFVKIAEEGSLSRASGVLGIAQPALSRQMRMLETEIGVSLFRRTRRGMQLTEDGEQLRAAVTGPLRQLELAFQSARSSATKIEGTLAVGMPAAIECVFAEPFVRRMSAELPNIKLRIVEGQAGYLIDWLHGGAIDLAILYGPSPDDRLIDRDLLVEDLMLVGGPEARLDPKEPVDFQRLSELALVLPNQWHGVRSILDRAAARKEIKLNIQFESDSFHLTKDLVRSGRGYTVLPLSAIGRELAEGQLTYTSIANPRLTQHLVHASRPLCQLPRIMAKVDCLIRHEISELVASGRWPAKLLFDTHEPKSDTPREDPHLRPRYVSEDRDFELPVAAE